MELTNDQIALLAGFGAIAASIMLMTLSYYLGQTARQCRSEQDQQTIAPAGRAIASQRGRSKAA
jgi:hypothetical protein